MNDLVSDNGWVEVEAGCWKIQKATFSLAITCFICPK